MYSYTTYVIKNWRRLVGAHGNDHVIDLGRGSISVLGERLTCDRTWEMIYEYYLAGRNFAYNGCIL